MKKGKNKKIPLFLISALLLGFASFIIFKFVNFKPKLLNNRQDDIVIQNLNYQIDVLNGCGVDDVAFQITQYLRIKGFDVVAYGNYETVVTKSFIIDHVGKPDTAKLIARVLGIDEKNVINSRSNYYNEFTVVIGKDYIKLKPFENKIEENF